jgi:hypothetical protein
MSLSAHRRDLIGVDGGSITVRTAAARMIGGFAERMSYRGSRISNSSGVARHGEHATVLRRAGAVGLTGRPPSRALGMLLSDASRDENFNIHHPVPSGRQKVIASDLWSNELVVAGSNSSDDTTRRIIHETVVMKDGQPIGKLENAIVQFPFQNFEEVLGKANRYSTFGARMLAHKRVSMWSALGHATWAFLKHYVFKRGFIDGWAGFVIAFGNFEGTFYRYAKRYEEMQNWQPPESTPLKRPD